MIEYKILLNPIVKFPKHWHKKNLVGAESFSYLLKKIIRLLTPEDLQALSIDIEDGYANIWVGEKIVKKTNYIRRKIKRNMAQCKKCRDIIESKHVHDFVYCKCESIFVDGGKDYLRRGGGVDDILELSEYDE